jgi:16S rRNA (guanine527-N7)-methyltransferase
MTPRVALERGVNQLALGLSAGACEKLLGYLALLGKWNRTYNLTAIRDPLAMVSHHLLDSLAVLPYLPLADVDARLADAGAGAGLPGIPLAVARPQWQVSLVESNEKKAAFLRQAAIELGIPNIEVHEGRIEAWRPAKAFALVISRAFAELADFIDSCRHLLAPNGVFAAMKGKDPRAEIGRLPADVRCRQTVRLTVPFMDAERHLVLCELRA